MTLANARKKLIIFEGHEASGKTYMVKQTKQWCDTLGIGARVGGAITAGPYSILSSQVRKALHDEGKSLGKYLDANLFLDGVIANFYNDVLPALSKNDCEVFIMDRGFLSFQTRQLESFLDTPDMHAELSKRFHREVASIYDALTEANVSVSCIYLKANAQVASLAAAQRNKEINHYNERYKDQYDLLEKAAFKYMEFPLGPGGLPEFNAWKPYTIFNTADENNLRPSQEQVQAFLKDLVTID